MLDGGRWSNDNEKHILRVRDYLIIGALRAGKHAIVDDTNLYPRHEARMREIAEQEGAEFTIKDFTKSITVDECIKRDLKRSDSVGEGVIRRFYNKYVRIAASPPEVVENGKLCVICDIDGTLAHMNGRGPFEWDQVGYDNPDETIALLVNGLKKSGHEIIIFSGRDGSCEERTRRWLAQNKIKFDFLFMRPEGSHTRDSVIKERMYRDNIEGKYNVAFVLDDRNQVVEMWRDLGLKCLQVADGDF